jgi:DUF4097 and DUF4098 domain-containing protein YvlB
MMKRFSKICVLVGAALLVVGLGVAAVGWGLGAIEDIRSVGSVETAPENYTAENVSRLEISLSSADVTVLPSPDGDLHITCSDSSNVQFTGQLEETVTGERVYTLTQRAIQPEHWWEVLQIRFTSQEDDVTVYVPENLALSVSTLSGDVDLENVILGDCALTTTSGDLYVEDATLTGTLTTVSGDVALDPATVPGNLSVKTTSGDIFLNLAGAPAHQAAEISSLSGETFVSGCDENGAYSLTVTSTSGDIVVLEAS